MPRLPQQLQEWNLIYKKVFRGLQSQNFYRSISHGSGRYRGPEGRKCAVGHLIPDEDYRPSMEGEIFMGVLWTKDRGVWENLIKKYPILFRNRNFITSLQAVHDESESRKLMIINLRTFAKKNGLQVIKTYASGAIPIIQPHT